VNIFLVISIDL